MQPFLSVVQAIGSYRSNGNTLKIKFLTTESNNREDALYFTDALHIIGNAKQRHAPGRRHERFRVPLNMRAAGDAGS